MARVGESHSIQNHARDEAGGAVGAWGNAERMEVGNMGDESREDQKVRADIGF
jgi:hypothetical protein